MVANNHPGKLTKIATLAGGCFWCTEAIFQRVKGVDSVTPGYTGGHTKNPTYNQVCSGTTGHAEAIQIKFNPNEISYAELLEIFFRMHDPTQLNRQGNDVGTQYRSAIFYHDENQRQTAETTVKKLNNSDQVNGPIVTEVVKTASFYPAEKYHHDYYTKNSYQPYCQYVIDPKIKKFFTIYRNIVKNKYKI